MKRPTEIIQALKKGTLHGPVPTSTVFKLMEYVTHLEQNQARAIQDALDLNCVASRVEYNRVSDALRCSMNTLERIETLGVLDDCDDMTMRKVRDAFRSLGAVQG